MSENVHSISKETSNSKLKNYAVFAKSRLASLVVFSAAIGYVVATKMNPDWKTFAMLVIGGFLVTASSNGFNQIIEKDLDKLMERTRHRPLPQNKMSLTEAFIVAALMGIAGVTLLALYTNLLCSILGATALILYTLVYTPLKRITPFAVFIGAFPGAIPPLLGCVAATPGFGEIKLVAVIMFFVQFIWQFPHFWAIAWVMDDDYKKAGFKMLPTGHRDRGSAFQILVYTLFLIPISLSPVYFNFSGSISLLINLAAGSVFAYQAYQVFKSESVKHAQQLMFGSFIYLPIVQLSIMLG